MACRTLLDPFPHPPEVLCDALCYCDITTGPTGETMTLAQRIAEVGHRRGVGSIVHRALELAQPRLELAAENTLRLIDESMATG